MLPIQTLVGGQAPATKGSAPGAIRTDPTGAIINGQLHGDFYEQAVRGNIFSGGNLGGAATTAGFATTFTGIVLSNPIGSLVNLVVNKFNVAELAAQTSALILGLMGGYSTGTAISGLTALVPKSNLIGQPAGVGLLSSAATLPIAPTNIRLLGSLLTGAITTGPQGGSEFNINGSIIVPPGGFIASYTNAASVAASLAFGFEWEEVSTTI